LSKAFNLKKIDLLNLQYGDVDKDIQNVRSNNIFINQIDEIDNMEDIDGLASLISVCDFVVTISNVIAHIAGSLGIKTYLLLPYSNGSLWYWHDDHDHSLWYPSIHIFRQDESRNWLTVIHELSEHLKKEYACV
jgi:ADP-heptose:LPS heptosyltransferase